MRKVILIVTLIVSILYISVGIFINLNPPVISQEGIPFGLSILRYGIYTVLICSWWPVTKTVERYKLRKIEIGDSSEEDKTKAVKNIQELSIYVRKSWWKISIVIVSYELLFVTGVFG